MKIDGSLMKILFELAEELHEGDIPIKEVIDQLTGKGLDVDFIYDYMSIYPCLLNGKSFRNSINGQVMSYYLDRIFETKGMACLQNALQALSLHIDCNEDASDEEIATNKEILTQYSNSYGFLCDEYFEETIPDYITIKEGITKFIPVNLYERNPIARSKSIEYHGAVCQVCDFNFETKYGKIGKGFIQVHHVVDILTIGDDYVLDAVNDLKPVCPNCHAMLHKKQPAYQINELLKTMNEGLLPTSYAKHWGFGGA